MYTHVNFFNKTLIQNKYNLIQIYLTIYYFLRIYGINFFSSNNSFLRFNFTEINKDGLA